MLRTKDSCCHHLQCLLEFNELRGEKRNFQFDVLAEHTTRRRIVWSTRYSQWVTLSVNLPCSIISRLFILNFVKFLSFFCYLTSFNNTFCNNFYFEISENQSTFIQNTQVLVYCCVAISISIENPQVRAVLIFLN